MIRVDRKVRRDRKAIRVRRSRRGPLVRKAIRGRRVRKARRAIRAGSRGPPGPQGAPGEVTAQQLGNTIAGTSANTNAVATLDTPFADPDLEAIRQKLNELPLAARR